ncbi:hypothetical protein [Leifsonia sp. AG29]|uniref:hypothetical protein n=1 Tax=Leifsonia sp. AG29 TaxID=2598860 RepID=UPI00131BF8DC|nr:hypothetical protein [Leifsonia sp. AG29]
MGRRPITGDGTNGVVSLTTYGRRLRTVHIAVESIAAGHLLPSAIILWVDAEQFELATRLPPLQRLRARGLELRVADSELRSHKKYFHFVQDPSLSAKPLVIADDDLLYPRTWYADLWDRFTQANGSAVISAWVKRPGVADGRLTPYESWPNATDTTLMRGNYFMGGSGTIFPIAFNGTLAAEGDRFLSIAPTSDDAWLNSRTHRAGLLVGQSTSESLPIRVIPGTQARTLGRENLGSSGTNWQLTRLYESEDLSHLARADGSVGGDQPT